MSKVRQSNVDLLNAIHLEGSNAYQQRVPLTTQNNLAETQKQLMGLPTNLWNEWEGKLVNRIGRTIIRRYKFGNPLAEFKVDGLILDNGSMLQEIAMGLVEARGYSFEDNNLFEIAKQETYAAIHVTNRFDRYDVSIARNDLNFAFTSDTGLNDFIVRKLEMAAISAAFDEYNIMKELIAYAFKEYGIYTVNVPFANPSAPTDAELKYLSVKTREIGKQLGLVPNGKFNSAHVPTVTPTGELVLITTPAVTANLDVNVLADAFNQDRTNFVNRVVEIDEFPIPGVYAMLVDRAFFVCGDVLNDITDFPNPKNLVNTYYWHYWGLYSVSPFANAVIFGEIENTVTETVDVKLTSLSASFVDEDEIAVTEFDYDELPKLVVTANGDIDPDVDFVQVPGSYTTEVSIAGVTKNTKSYVNRDGYLRLQKGLPAGTVVTVKVTSAYINPDAGDGKGPNPPITATASLTVAGDEDSE